MTMSRSHGHLRLFPTRPIPIRPAPIRPALVCLVMICLAAPAWAGSPLDDLLPTGFDGLELNTALDDVPGLTPSRVVRVQSVMDGDHDVHFYTRQDQAMTVYGAHLTGVEYGFCEDRLCSILVTATGEDNYRALLEHYQAAYGTEDKTAFAYDTVWDRVYSEENTDGITTHLWIVCERQTDNCALAGLTWQERISRAGLNIGEQVNPD